MREHVYAIAVQFLHQHSFFVNSQIVEIKYNFASQFSVRLICHFICFKDQPSVFLPSNLAAADFDWDKKECQTLTETTGKFT